MSATQTDAATIHTLGTPPDQMDRSIPKGTTFIGKHGDKRIRLADLTPKTENGVTYLGLDQILLGNVTLTNGDTTVELRPMNMGALAEIQARFGDVPNLTGKAADMIAVVTILANQDREPGDRISEATVGRLLTMDKMPLVAKLLGDLINPLVGGPSPTATARPTGPESSTSSPATSG